MLFCKDLRLGLLRNVALFGFQLLTYLYFGVFNLPGVKFSLHLLQFLLAFIELLAVLH